jgi:hypothetical protein
VVVKPFAPLATADQYEVEAEGAALAAFLAEEAEAAGIQVLDPEG